MKSLNLISIVLLLIIFFSCSTQEAVSPSESISQYSNLEIGNYWVYEWFEVTPNGTEDAFGIIDSIFIQKDTLIDNQTFFIKSGSFLGHKTSSILFDSANSIYLYPKRELLFTIDETQEATKYFGLEDDPLAIGYYTLIKTLESVVVPAGTFDCFNFQGKIEPLETNYQYGTRFNSNLYSKGVGLVKMTTQFYNSPNDLEMRLISYGKN